MIVANYSEADTNTPEDLCFKEYLGNCCKTRYDLILIKILLVRQVMSMGQEFTFKI